MRNPHSRATRRRQLSLPHVASRREQRALHRWYPPPRRPRAPGLDAHASRLLMSFRTAPTWSRRWPAPGGGAGLREVDACGVPELGHTSSPGLLRGPLVFVDEAAQDWAALDPLPGEIGGGVAGPGRAELAAAVGAAVGCGGPRTRPGRAAGAARRRSASGR